MWMQHDPVKQVIQDPQNTFIIDIYHIIPIKRSVPKKRTQWYYQGYVSINTTDRPTGRRTILPCYLSIAEWSDARLDGPSCLMKQPPVFFDLQPGVMHESRKSSTIGSFASHKGVLGTIHPVK